MKKISILVIFAVLMAACQKDVDSASQNADGNSEKAVREVLVSLVPSEEITKTTLEYEDSDFSKASSFKWSDGDMVAYWQTDNDNYSGKQARVATVENGSFTAVVEDGMTKMKVIYPASAYAQGAEYDHTPDISEQTQSEANVFNPANLRLKANVELSGDEEAICAEYNTVGCLVRWALTGDGERVKTFGMNLYNNSFATVRRYSVTLEKPITLSAEPQYVYIVCQERQNTYMEPGTVILEDGTVYDYISASQKETPLLNNSMKRAKLEFSTSKFAPRTNLDGGGATSNCYIVSSPGSYSFNACVQGNSAETVGTPAEASLIWCYDAENVAQKTNASPTVCKNVRYENGRIVFTAVAGSDGKLVKGNSLLAIKDKDETILWSWHIWATENPEDVDITTPNAHFKLMDRNLGATHFDGGFANRDSEKISLARGLFYQWGRKDPFILNNWTLKNATTNVQTAVKNPTVIYSDSNSSWTSVEDKTLWQDDTKTKYDPCPVGYKVPKRDVFRFMAKYNTTEYSACFITRIDPTFKEGVFPACVNSYDDKSTWSGETFFPMGGNIKHGITTVGRDGVGTRGDYWTSSCGTTTGRALRVYFADQKFYNTEAHMDYGFSIRCVKEN